MREPQPLAPTPADRSAAARTPPRLHALPAANVLYFKTDGALPPELAALARVTGRIVELPAHDPAEIERHLAKLREAGVKVEDLEIRKADLEDVFIALMNGQRVPAAVGGTA